MQFDLQTESGLLRGVISIGARMSNKGVLLLHPHPLYGGNMNNNVILAIDDAVNGLGVTTLRFDFRGPNSSSGQYEGPRGAVADASSMIVYLKEKMGVSEVAIIGYSFGGSVALGVSLSHHPALLITLSASIEILKESGVILDDLSRISCPSLLIHGQSDRLVPFSDMKSISAHLGGSVESLRVESEGHFYVSSLSTVVSEVLVFLHKVWDTDLKDN